LEQLSLFPGDSRASRSPQQEKEKEQEMIGSCGRRCYELYAQYIPDGLLRKMSEVLLASKTAWYSKDYSLTWKVKGIRYSRLLFQLVPSVRHTDGIEYGSLPTPDANMGKRGEMKEWKPIRPSGHHACLTLNDAVKMLPTPTARDYKSPNGADHMKKTRPHMDQLPNVVRDGMSNGQKLRLEPAFVEFMMGFPEGWTELID